MHWFRTGRLEDLLLTFPTVSYSLNLQSLVASILGHQKSGTGRRAGALNLLLDFSGAWFPYLNNEGTGFDFL